MTPQRRYDILRLALHGFAADARQFVASHVSEHKAAILEAARDAQELHDALAPSVDMILHCPSCHQKHIDASERDSHAPCTYCEAPPAAPCYGWCTTWANPPHRTHLCAFCGHKWRPANVATNGVDELPDAPR